MGLPPHFTMTRNEILLRFLRNYLSVSNRGLPTVIIAGAQKAGTTSLFLYLDEHPDVYSSFIKEPQFFNRRYHWGVRGYRAFFAEIPPGRSGPMHILESSPDYLFLPEVPDRMVRLLPQVRLVFLFREPLARALSHYQHNVRRGWETRSFREVMTEDTRRWKEHGIERCPDETWREFRDFSYVRRGVYAPQIDRWLRLFPRNNILLLRAEDLFSDPRTATSTTLSFLGLTSRPLANPKPFNDGSYDRSQLQEYAGFSGCFADSNERMCREFGIQWPDSE